MTVSTETASVSYAGNGVTVTWAVPYYILESSHVRVTLRSSAGGESIKTLTTDYTVANAGTNPSTATVTAVSFIPATGETILIDRDVPATQETDLAENDSLPAETVERVFDKLTMLYQQVATAVTRALRLPASSPVSSQLAEPAAGQIPRVNSDATGIDWVDYSVSVPADEDFIVVSNVATMKALTGLVDGALVQTVAYSGSRLGGRTYQYSTTTGTNNDVTIINSDSTGSFHLLRDKPVSMHDAGLIGDGATVNAVADVQQWLDAAGALHIPDGYTFLTNGDLAGSSNTTITGHGALKSNAAASTILTVDTKSNFVWDGPTIDGGNQADLCAYFKDSTDVAWISGKVKDTLDSTENFRGGVIFDGCTRPRVGVLEAENISITNSETRAFSFTNCTDAIADELRIDGCGKAMHLSGSTRVQIGKLLASNVEDNGAYLIGALQDVTIGQILVDTCGEGIVLNSSVADARINIGQAIIIDAANRGITLRTGGGYTIGDVVVDGCINGLAQSSSFAGVDGLTITSSLKIRNATGRPVDLDDDQNVRIHNLFVGESGDTIAVDVSATCNNIYFYNPTVNDSTATTTTAIRYLSDGATAYKGGVYWLETTAASGVSTATDGFQDNIVVIYRDFTLNTSVTIRTHSGNDEVAKVQVGTRNASVANGEAVGRYTMYTSDTTGSGAREFFIMEGAANNASGSTYQVTAKVDAGDGLIILSTGASVKLPTASTGLPTGAIYNNAGVITIV